MRANPRAGLAPAIRRFFVAALLAMGAPGTSWAGASIAEAIGVVQLLTPAYDSWRIVDRTPRSLNDGDQVRTGTGASAIIKFDDGSRVELGADSAFTLETTSGGSAMSMQLGRMRAFVQKLFTRRFQVRTPTAVCSVRGTEFYVQVAAGGRTTVELYKGLLGVEDMRGNQTLLKPNERLTIDMRGLTLPERRPSETEKEQAGLHETAKNEVGLEMSKEQVLAAAAREAKLSEFQQGKILLDVNGNRVRLEEYILRPQADQFKLVVLNERESRFDYFYYTGTFNKALPTDLATALRQLPGCAGAQCEYYLTGFESGRSNTSDSAFERGLNTIGGQVNVNANADAGDDVKFLFDSAKDQYVDVTGTPVFQTIMNRYGFYVNGKLKYGWNAPGTITSYNDVGGFASTVNDPLTGAALTNATAWLDPNTSQLATRSVSVTFPSGGKFHQRIYESYSDGSHLQWDNYVIDDEGRISPIADFAGITSGAGFKKKLLNYNYEQILTSSHFSGRKIDLVVEPKILIESGLIP